MKKLMIVFAAISLALVVASPAMAYRCMGPANQGGSCNWAPAGTPAGVSLTAEQTEKINALREAHWKEIKPIKDQLHSKRGDLRMLWLAKAPDKDKILELQKEVQNLRGQIMEKATIHRLEMSKVLTPEQLAKVQSPYGMGRAMAGRGAGMGSGCCGAGMERMGCGAGTGPACGGAAMGPGCCGAGMERMGCGAGTGPACGGAGMRGGQPSCCGMR